MACWCDEVQDYKCCNCEAEEVFKKLDEDSKIKLLSLQKCINTADFKRPEYRELAEFIFDNDLSISMIPEKNNKRG